MKKAAAAFLSLGFLSSVTAAFATPTPTGVSVKINPPNFGIDPTTAIGTLITNALTIIFIIAAILVLFYLVWGAFEWITSGGDKEGIGKARNRIIQSLVGLVILALAFLIIKVVGQIININILSLPDLPSLGQSVPTPTPTTRP